MSFRLPGLTHLRCFDSAARHQSFTAAAEEMGMTQGAISKKVKELEMDLGFELFQRVGRGVVLTVAGRNFATALSSDLGGLQKTVRNAVAAGTGKSTLAIATLPTFANLWLIPRLPDFFKCHPDIELSFSTRLAAFEFQNEPFDLAFHYGTDNWPGTKMTHLFGENMIPVCSPDFKRANGLSDPRNLANVPLLHLASRTEVWPEWSAKTGGIVPARRDGRYFDQHSMVISAAIVSLGAAMVPLAMVARELTEGQLVRIDGPELATGKSYFLVRPAGRASDAMHDFETWVTQQARVS